MIHFTWHLFIKNSYLIYVVLFSDHGIYPQWLVHNCIILFKEPLVTSQTDSMHVKCKLSLQMYQLYRTIYLEMHLGIGTMFNQQKKITGPWLLSQIALLG